jgi:glutathione S-transferase
MLTLVGNYLSPFTRRVAVSLNALDIPFVLDLVYVFKEPERVRAHNPVVRIPALLLDNRDVVVESYAILDEIDRMVGPERALTPPAGEQRRLVMKITAVALASMEKAQWAFYERRVRPEEKVHQPWIDHNDRQVVGGLHSLEEFAEATGREGWLAGWGSASVASRYHRGSRLQLRQRCAAPPEPSARDPSARGIRGAMRGDADLQQGPAAREDQLTAGKGRNGRTFSAQSYSGAVCELCRTLAMPACPTSPSR